MMRFLTARELRPGDLVIIPGAYSLSSSPSVPVPSGDVCVMISIDRTEGHHWVTSMVMSSVTGVRRWFPMHDFVVKVFRP